MYLKQASGDSLSSKAFFGQKISLPPLYLIHGTGVLVNMNVNVNQSGLVHSYSFTGS